MIGSAKGGTLLSHTGGIGLGGVKGAAKFHTGDFNESTGEVFAGMIDNVRLYNSSVDNPLPSPVLDSVSTDEDTGVVVDFLDNDTDSDGDFLFISAVTDGANGTVTISGGEVTYDPNPDYFGTDSFTYSVSDGFGGTASATGNRDR